MDEDGAKRVCTRRADDRIEKLDRLSNLPDCLIIQILLNLPTKVVVKTSVLSKRWRNLWRYVPVLDLEYDDFRQYNNALVSFVDKFLGDNRESWMQKFKYKFDDYHVDNDSITRWINIVVKLKVQHLHVLNKLSSYIMWMGPKVPTISPTVYTCESLVSLKLGNVILPVPEFVSLPSLKVIKLNTVKFANDLAFEMLISGCPVLEILTLDNVDALRVCSKSLLRFTLIKPLDVEKDDRVVAIDAPRLEYLNIGDHKIANFILNNILSLVKLQMRLPLRFSITKMFDSKDHLKRKMIGNFLNGVSIVKAMDIHWDTLEVIYGYSKYEKLPLFRNLSFLTISFGEDANGRVLPILLESCPNLKSLEMIVWDYVYGICVVPGLRRFLASLEYVKILWLGQDNEETRMKVARFFLKNSPILQKFTFRIRSGKKNEHTFLKKLLSIPRLSTSCRVVVL